MADLGKYVRNQVCRGMDDRLRLGVFLRRARNLDKSASVLQKYTASVLVILQMAAGDFASPMKSIGGFPRPVRF